MKKFLSKIFNIFFKILLLATPFTFTSCLQQGTPSTQDTNNSDSPKGFEIVKTILHEQDSFTQGLAFYKGYLFEGTGLTGKSEIRKIDLQTEEIIKRKNIIEHCKNTTSGKCFGEGITIFNEKIYQLTWQDQKVYIYDLHDFNLLKTVPLPQEAWGITNDGKELIISKGNSEITFHNPNTLVITRSITTFGKGVAESSTSIELNELEYIKGQIWANIWKKNEIVLINPITGEIQGSHDFSFLAKKVNMPNPSVNVLNGIAFDPNHSRLYITGKRWPYIYQFQL